MQFSRRDFLKLAGFGLAGSAAGWRIKAAFTPSVNPLYLLAPERSVSEALLSAFSTATGIKLVRRSSSDLTDLDSYDLAVVPSYTLTRLIQQDAVRELDRLSIATRLEQRAYDPLNAFSLPAARGAIGINAQGFTPPATWSEFFDLAKSEPAYLPCPDSHNAVLKMMGESINTRNLLARQRVDEILAQLNAAPLADTRLAIGSALPGWNFVIPTEGAELWEDCFCIPTNSAQPAWAQAFMQFAVEQQTLAPLPDLPLEPLSAFAPILSIL
jgi:spermidine/putrescine-binding protein